MGFIDDELMVSVDLEMTDEEIGKLIRLALDTSQSKPFTVKQCFGYLRYTDAKKSGNENLLKLFDMKNIDINEIKALDGRIFATLNNDELEIFNYFRDRGRKYGVSVDVVSKADQEELARATSKEQTDYVLRSKNSVVTVEIVE